MYLYCIVESGTPAHAMLAQRRIPGLVDARPLEPVEVAGLVAAVSLVPGSQFQEEPLNALVADLNRLTPFAVRHEAAIGAVVKGAPAVIPLGFGTVYRDVSGVAAMLRERAAALREILDRVRHRFEWGLRVTVDFEAMRQFVEANSAALRQLDDEVGRAGRGRAYLLQKRRQQVADSERLAVIGETLEAIFRQLAAISVDARQDELPPIPPTGTRQLVLKAAFLVDVQQQPLLESTVLDLATAYRPRGVFVDVTGPWAAYSFVRIGTA